MPQLRFQPNRLTAILSTTLLISVVLVAIPCGSKKGRSAGESPGGPDPVTQEELPPPTDALVDSLNVIFTRNLHDLSKAEWASVERNEYMRIVRERKQQCPVYADVVLREDEAATGHHVHQLLVRDCGACHRRDV